jgi:5-methylcytosine-specific restriction protein A
MSTTRRTLGVFSTKRPLGEHGERLCYNCLGPLPPHRRFNCSKECSKAWRVRTSHAYMRYLVFQRDHGVCALCSADTVALQKEYSRLPNSTERSHFRDQHGIPVGRSSSDWWDADHIVPVIEGGGECDLANFRTLCLPCHKKVTRELRHRLVVNRKDAARPLFQGLFDA